MRLCVLADAYTAVTAVVVQLNPYEYIRVLSMILLYVLYVRAQIDTSCGNRLVTGVQQKYTWYMVTHVDNCLPSQ